jgi:hypothetical protein
MYIFWLVCVGPRWIFCRWSLPCTTHVCCLKVLCDWPNYWYCKTDLKVSDDCNVNITIIIVDIIHENEFCPRLQVEPSQMGPADRASLFLRTPATTPVGYIKPKVNSRCWIVLCWFYRPYWWCCWSPETETRCIYWVQLIRFHLKSETESSQRNVVKRQDDG